MKEGNREKLCFVLFCKGFASKDSRQANRIVRTKQQTQVNEQTITHGDKRKRKKRERLKERNCY